MKRKNGSLPAARRLSSGMATSLSFSALGLRPSFQEPQPVKSRYFLKPREAGLELNPTQVVA
jgi:hypothetical protein